VLDAKVSAERAREAYGVVVDQASGSVDAAATERLREQRREAA
jgi:hypothetical protein